ncbi:Uu.00g000050.m01.CDS01 [Anthostomella pinea]|uniref:Uu.00g000050.m01.CDS01 n=1 Tax=Anthostomella pinea TaxID=933095 RepID=A0AAI8VK31_9PEZI|nr:Uu.00g000050.m01.CDS01 [Anthostomella pinea]
MATPQSTASGDAPPAAKGSLEQITFRFCSECSNMLYPKEDEDAHKLQFTCRTCQYTVEATSSCVFRNVMNNAAGETAGVTQDVGSDPTVRSHVSFHSSHAPAGAHASHASAPATADDDLAVCLRCGMTLLHCSRCKDPASIDEYNHFVKHHLDFAVAKTLGYIGVASLWNALDTEGRTAWDARFASCRGVNLGHLSQDTLAHYLPFEIALNPNADPPEALGIDQEDYDNTDFLV